MFPSFSFTSMSTPTFDYTIFYEVPEIFPDSIINNNPIHHSPIPHYVKHPLWYFDDADLFFSQCGILFGLHQQKFNNSYFSQHLKHITMLNCSNWNISSLLISINTLSISTLIAFI